MCFSGKVIKLDMWGIAMAEKFSGKAEVGTRTACFRTEKVGLLVYFQYLLVCTIDRILQGLLIAAAAAKLCSSFQ